MLAGSCACLFTCAQLLHSSEAPAWGMVLPIVGKVFSHPLRQPPNTDMFTGHADTVYPLLRSLCYMIPAWIKLANKVDYHKKKRNLC